LQVSVSDPQLPHAAVRVAAGVHTGALGHEHDPQPQAPEQVSVPYVLHAWVVVGAQAP
jgi:hypothetical protein